MLVDDKILGRTRVLRNSLTRIGSDRREDPNEERGGGAIAGEDGKDSETIWEIFDDTDFYHQILRDVVDAKKRGDGQYLQRHSIALPMLIHNTFR